MILYVFTRGAGAEPLPDFSTQVCESFTDDAPAARACASTPRFAAARSTYQATFTTVPASKFTGPVAVVATSAIGDLAPRL